MRKCCIRRDEYRFCRGGRLCPPALTIDIVHCGHHTVIFLPYRTTAPPVWDNAPNDSRCRGMTWANRLRYEWQRITYSPEEQVLPPGGCRHPPLQMIKGSSTMRPGEKSKRGGAHAPFLVALRGLPRGKFEIPLGRPFLFPLKAFFFPAQGKKKGLNRSLFCQDRKSRSAKHSKIFPFLDSPRRIW